METKDITKIFNETAQYEVCGSKNETIKYMDIEDFKLASKQMQQRIKELQDVLEETVKEFRYALNNLASFSVKDYDKRQEFINQNSTIIKAETALNNKHK